MRRFLLLILCAVALEAAEPDWPAVEKHALDLLQRYVRIKSVNPPADTSATAALLASELEKHGLEPKVYKSGPANQTDLLVRLKGKDPAKKPLLLLNHMDVVPVDRGAWRMDPFGALIQGGQIWGRGTLDMKGIGIQQLTALVTLKDMGVVPARDIVMISTADEETNGQRGIQWMIANHYAEFDPEYVLDEGGMGSRDVLAPGKLVFGVSVGEKQMLWLRLRAKGTSGHGSQPIPDNANLILIHAIEKALAQPAKAKPNPLVEEMIRAAGGVLAKNKFTNAIQANTISPTTLAAGVGSPPKINVIPSASEATLDCRLLPGVNPDEFISEMKARITDPRVTIEKLAEPVDAGASNFHTPLFAAIRQAILKSHPDAAVMPMLVPFGTDSVFLRKRGVIAYGLTPMVLDFATVATFHSDEEHIPVAEFLKGLHIYYDALRSDF